jgi:Tfp pilus assembly protein PilF
MSLLADLLSKKSTGESAGMKDIPPTLSRAHGFPAKDQNIKNRYVVISAISVAAIAIGLVAVTQYEWMVQLVTGTSAVVPQAPKPLTPIVPLPVPVPVVSEPATPQAVVMPSVEQKDEPEEIVAAVPARKKAAPTKKPTRHKPYIRYNPPDGLAIKAVPVTIAPDSASSGRADTAKRDALLYSARSAELVSDWRSALASYRKALKIDPDNFKIRNNVAAALNNLGMFNEGAEEAKLALEEKPDYVPAMINAAIAYSSSGNSLEALQLFSKASSADPTNRTLAINLGILQERTGKLEEAAMTYRQMAEAGDPLALHGMARIHERKGNRIEAVRAYRHILTLPNASSTLKKEAKDKLMRLEE